jgi:cobalt-zinc-cadmium efflux system membrane fusion protein
MTSTKAIATAPLLAYVFLCGVAGCKSGSANSSSEAPPAATVQQDANPDMVQVKKPQDFPLFTVTAYEAPSSLQVTGTVSPDVSRTIPVISIANGRVLSIHARLGDFVKKGQLLMEVQSTDVSGAFDAYLKAVNDEHLTRVQLDRAKLLYSKGAIPQSQMEVAQQQEDDNIADLTATREQLRVLGLDPDHPSATVKVYAPASGYIIAQNVTNSAAAGVALSGNSTAFTIADLSHVWVLCDVYENNLAQVHLGQKAEIHLAAYPNRVLTGTISDIGPVLDPTTRSAKVRVEVDNPATLMRVGMFVTANLFSKSDQTSAAIPANAILHLHDRDWVYEPAGGGNFRRAGVVAGDMLPNGMQEVKSGLAAGQQVVSNALTLQNTVDQ